MPSKAQPEIPDSGAPPVARKPGFPVAIGAAALSVLRSAVRYARHLPDRMLHRRRYRRAREAVRQLPRVRSVLVLCHGNVCRSPFAAAVFDRLARQSLGIDLDVSSAGFIGPGRQSPPEARAAALRRSYELEDHRSQLATGTMLRAA